MSSPSSFAEAWESSFFTASALLLLTSLGFVVSWVPTLDKLPLGGRLRHCIQTLRKVCNNNWVLNVVSEGYKIPFKFVPFQRFWPRNLKVSGPAFEMLAQEAADLLAKESVAPVAPVKDSLYTHTLPWLWLTVLGNSDPHGTFRSSIRP